MDYGQLQEFARKHGPVSIMDTQGTLPSGDPDTHDLIQRADRFLWDGLFRERAEMEALLSQSERGLRPGCELCEQLETALIAAREQDRKEGSLDQKNTNPALWRFQDHRLSH
ncbi:MAG TPA: hypothetical protein VHA33_24370 [Candidatus Angelobacter sp.]|nr:hypothetical protein [Candidatus Angelobacter sp.]